MPILLLIISAAAAVLFGFLAATSSPYFTLGVAISLLVFLLAFSSPKLSLVLLLVSMMFSPEIGLGALTGSRSVVIRYDDILLIVIFVSWLARTAIFKDRPFVVSTPVQVPIVLYTSVCILSTTFGILRGDIRTEVAFFYLLKYVEYFLLYFMTINILDTKEDMRKYMKYGLYIALAVTVYAYYYYAASGPDSRATAPFEAPIGDPGESEPASLGGYFLIVMGVLYGFVIHGGARTMGWATGILGLMFPAFLLTFSRASYIGFAVMTSVVVAKAARRRLLLLSIFLIGLFALFGAKEFSGKVKERVEMTYAGRHAVYEVSFLGVGLKLEESAYLRYVSIRDAFQRWLPKHPVLGRGVTGVGLGDTQYALLIGETGLVGFFLFFWMIFRIYSTAGSVYGSYGEPWIKAASLGLMVAIPALLAQAVGVNTFIVVRIMEPFWFLTAVIMKLHISSGKATAANASRTARVGEAHGNG